MITTTAFRKAAPRARGIASPTQEKRSKKKTLKKKKKTLKKPILAVLGGKICFHLSLEHNINRPRKYQLSFLNYTCCSIQSSWLIRILTVVYCCCISLFLTHPLSELQRLVNYPLIRSQHYMGH